jgi:small subunit ribosomal protein S21
MLIIDAQNGGIEKALKVLKRKFSQTGVVRELRERKEFKKPSVRRREEIQKAIHRARYIAGQAD